MTGHHININFHDPPTTQRPANGGPFVYHGVRLFESPDGRVEEALGDYIFGVLGTSKQST